MPMRLILFLILFFAITGASTLTGRVVWPTDPQYATSVAEWNGAAPHNHPVVLVFASSTVDVVNALTYAHQHTPRLNVSVRSGRGDYEALSVIDGGVVIDVTPMRDVNVRVGGDQIEIGAGVRVMELYAAEGVIENNLLIPLSSGAIIGVSGLILGGGYGFYSRKYGILSDSLIEAEVVLANGTVVLASAETESYSDLLWALKGGGAGSMGVVTRMLIQAQKWQKTVAVFSASWPGSAEVDVVRAWEDFAPSSSCTENLTLQLLLDVGGGVRGAGVYMGPSADLQELLAPMGKGARLNLTLSELHDISLIDAAVHWGNCGATLEDCLKAIQAGPNHSDPVMNKGKSIYLNHPIAEDFLDLVQAGPPTECAKGWSGVLLDPYGGRINAVPSNASAFVHRRGVQYHAQLLIYWDHTAEPAFVKCRRDYIERLYAVLWNDPSSTHETYQDYMDLDYPVTPECYFKQNLEQLCAVKRAYDPGSVFSMSMCDMQQP